MKKKITLAVLAVSLMTPALARADFFCNIGYQVTGSWFGYAYCQVTGNWPGGYTSPDVEDRR